MRPLWIVGVAVVVAASAVVVVRELGEPDLVPVVAPAGEVTIVGELTIDQGLGDTVLARATISADRELVVPALAVRVRDDTGRGHDFPQRTDIALGTTPTEVTFERTFDQPGTYRYSLAYRLDRDWVDLPPWQSVTIR